MGLSKWFSKNIEFGAPLRISRWRKISLASWRTTHDSSIVSVLELDAEPALRYLERLQSQSPLKLTVTHLSGYVLAKVFAKYPEVNCMVRLGRLYPRKSVDICFLVASGEVGIHGKEDLSGVTLREVDRLGVLKIAEGLTPTVRKMKRGEDHTFRGIKYYIGYFPNFFRISLVNLADWLMNVLNVWSPILGFQKDAFGSAMLTSVGSLDIEFAIPRIYPQSRNVMIMAVGAVREKPVVKDGKIIIGKRIKFVFTADHRIVDGLHASYLLKEFHTCFENPEAIPSVSL